MMHDIYELTSCYCDTWSSFLDDLHNLILATINENKVFLCISDDYNSEYLQSRRKCLTKSLGYIFPLLWFLRHLLSNLFG